MTVKMEVEQKIVICLIILVIGSRMVHASGKFLKIESCSTSNKTTELERCDLAENSLNIILNIKKPINQFYVI
jgi:hypothetical protein